MDDLYPENVSPPSILLSHSTTQKPHDPISVLLDPRVRISISNETTVTCCETTTQKAISATS